MSKPFQPRVTRLSAALGAEVHDVALAGIDEAGAKAIADLLAGHQVLFFPDQHLSIDDHVAFGAHFGELEGHPHLTNPSVDHPKVFELAASRGGVADEWHTDLTFRAEPALLSVLQMIRCPDVGGDTLWSSLDRAFAELSTPMRELCEGLTAIHNAEPHGKPDVMTAHPVVRIHPVTGRKVLYVNEHFTRRIVELSRPESDVLLGFLTKWVGNPRFTVRYRWKAGTVAMWDNRCTQHQVLNDFEGERVIHRVTVMGDRPEGAPPRWSPFVRPGGRSDTTRHDRLLRDYVRGRSQSE